jgi:hypothetical protein
MDEIPKASSAQLPPQDTGRWIGRVVVAVILAEAIWGFIVSLTNSLVLPALARIMGGDPQSPLYLGKGDFNVPAIFSSILEVCLSGIVAVILYQWTRSAPRVRVKAVKVRTVAAKTSMPSIAPISVTPPPASVPSVPAVTPQPISVPPPAAVSAPPVQPSAAAPPITTAAQQPSPSAPKPAAPAKAEKPKKPREVYYNIVGEPINPTEDD